MRRATSYLNAFCFALLAALAFAVLATGDAFGMQAVDATHALSPGVDWLNGFTGHLDTSFASGAGGGGDTPGFLAAAAGAAGVDTGEGEGNDPPQEGTDPPEEEEEQGDMVSRTWHEQQMRKKERELGAAQERAKEQGGKGDPAPDDEGGLDAEEIQSLREQVQTLTEERDGLQEQVEGFQASEKEDTVREGFQKHFDESKFDGPFSTDPVQQYVSEFSEGEDGELINDQGQSPEEFFGQLAQKDEYSEYRVRNSSNAAYEGGTNSGPAVATTKADMSRSDKVDFIEQNGREAYDALPAE